ncbi:MAG: ABC transporter permease [Acidobacteriota bacterium]|nr:ABC transporter permease [Acidobacteriota bacterium]MDQ5871765.1 ABC transporter permease [Acidobacteriota bacterium]
MKFAPLVENEVLKLLKRRRFRVALLILIALNGLIVFAQTQSRDRRPRRDWRIEAQERVARMQNWERSRRLPQTQLRWVRYEIARVQYHLDRNVDPDAISGPLFTRGFASASSYLLFPLLAILFAADIVSSEFAQGTIKLLLTRPVGRARVLSSKFAALALAITLTVTLGGVVAYLFGGLAFGYRGWGAPVLAGFRLAGDAFDPAGVRTLPLWQDTLLAFGLAWFATLAVGAIAFLTSVVLRSTAAAMGTMLAALIAGTILPRVAPTWEAQRYLFVTNLPLPDYYSGSPAPIAGMTVPFSVVVLAVWALSAAVVAYAVFLRRDVLA